MIKIVKYNNRKMYGQLENGKKGYLTLSDINDMVRSSKEFQVLEHRTNVDLTSEVLNECLTRLAIPDTIKKELIGRYLDRE